MMLLMLLLPWAPASAQSIITGEVGGSVVDQAGRPIRGASLVLTESRSSLDWTLRTRRDGLFTFGSIPGGSYELRVEALGFRPLVVVGLAITPGAAVSIPVRLTAETPPLTRVDTMHYSARGGGAPALGRQLGWEQLSALPDRYRDVAGLLAASTAADPEGGLEGLPVRFTTVYVDGQPFHPARHPAFQGYGYPLGLSFPRIGLQSASVRTGLEDVEWSGGTGGVVALETRPPLNRASGEIYGFWSGAPTWNNEVVGQGSALLSAWGGGSGSIPLAEGAAPLTISFEGALVETPNLFWRNDYFAEQVASDAPPPGTRTTSFGSGLARGAWRFGESGQVTLRASGSAFRRLSDRAGIPQADYGSELPGEGFDASVATVVSFPIGERFSLEIRGSGAGSSRTWEDDHGGRSGAFLVRDRALLGTNPIYPATSKRTDLTLSPVVHFRSGPNRLKGGIRLSHTSSDMSHVDQAAGEFFFGSRRGLQAGEGAAIRAQGDPPSVSSNSTRTNLFGQYRWTALRGLNLTTGVSFKIQTLPAQDVRPALSLTNLTGVTNVPGTTSLSALDGHVHLRWDLRGDGRSWFLGGLGLEHGVIDPAAVHEVLTLDGPVEVDRFLGGGLEFGDGGLPGTGAVSGMRLALFGPDLDLPRTARASLGLRQTLVPGFRIGISGTFRRTESILRRTDLNRLLVPTGTDQNGRPIFGDLRVLSGVLAADPASNRRFTEFESIWALSPDGWSEYRGVTASMDAAFWDEGSLSLRYTWSETTDNWVGASRAGAMARLPAELPVESWDEAASDFDIPHRFSALVLVPLPFPWGGTVSGLYTLRSAQPFTPRVATGLDANGDGSFVNDAAFIPASGSAMEELAQEWDCLELDMGGFATRNGCRGDPVHSLNVRLRLGLPQMGGLSGSLVIDGLNLTDADTGVRDDNLLLLGSGRVQRTDDGVEVPYTVNPGFGNWVHRDDRGRMIRLGIHLSAGEGR